ncbi:protein PHLOEM PROTEIN 2-LIKE A1-like isoform X2 [Macadamia integrifolia]|uniref:protein PHLOEM PROTEIN 2-LIKE A1-like isoform X2 n=1 Tax=Macadamia integrifolia TaxID=60698 RepID=UPI001C501A93|nr:protein PHLOEM PROTEIN 2-LIKE A1-like isoform X2 [Macadamia integrifolia]
MESIEATSSKSSSGYEISEEEEKGGLWRSLPHNCRAIIERSESPYQEVQTEKQLYDRLCSGVLLDQKRKAKSTGLIQKQAITVSCYFQEIFQSLGLRTHVAGNGLYFKNQAELKRVLRLEVRGKVETSNLSPGVMYEIAFLVMFKARAHGWDVPVTFELILPDGKKQEHKQSLLSYPEGEWVELLVGEFRTCQDMDGDLEFSLLEIEESNVKSGLVIKGVIIRPKNEQPLQNNHFSVIANDLSIEWGSDQRYWRWSSSNNCNLAEVELIKVYWLEVKGKFDTSKISSGIVYEVAFVVMLKDNACGWEVPVTLQLFLPNGEVQEHKECLLNKPKNQWITLYIGEFKKCAEKAGEIEFSLFENEKQDLKKGLVIKSVIILPKN